MTEYVGIGLSLILSIRTMPTTDDRVYWDRAEPDIERSERCPPLMTEYVGMGLSLILSIRTMPTTDNRVCWDGAEPDIEYQNDAHH
jgi:hypothetical protein